MFVLYAALGGILVGALLTIFSLGEKLGVKIWVPVALLVRDFGYYFPVVIIDAVISGSAVGAAYWIGPGVTDQIASLNHHRPVLTPFTLGLLSFITLTTAVRPFRGGTKIAEHLRSSFLHINR